MKCRFKCVFRDRNEIDFEFWRLELSLSFPLLFKRSTCPLLVTYLLKLFFIMTSFKISAFVESSVSFSRLPLDRIYFPVLIPRTTKCPFSMGTKSSWAYSEFVDHVEPSLVCEMVMCLPDIEYSSTLRRIWRAKTVAKVRISSLIIVCFVVLCLSE